MSGLHRSSKLWPRNESESCQRLHAPKLSGGSETDTSSVKGSRGIRAWRSLDALKRYIKPNTYEPRSAGLSNCSAEGFSNFSKHSTSSDTTISRRTDDFQNPASRFFYLVNQDQRRDESEEEDNANEEGDGNGQRSGSADSGCSSVIDALYPEDDLLNRDRIKSLSLTHKYSDQLSAIEEGDEEDSLRRSSHSCTSSRDSVRSTGTAGTIDSLMSKKGEIGQGAVDAARYSVRLKEAITTLREIFPPEDRGSDDEVHSADSPVDECCPPARRPIIVDVARSLPRFHDCRENGIHSARGEIIVDDPNGDEYSVDGTVDQRRFSFGAGMDSLAFPSRESRRTTTHEGDGRDVCSTALLNGPSVVDVTESRPLEDSGEYVENLERDAVIDDGDGNDRSVLQNEEPATRPFSFTPGQDSLTFLGIDAGAPLIKRANENGDASANVHRPLDDIHDMTRSPRDDDCGTSVWSGLSNLSNWSIACSMTAAALPIAYLAYQRFGRSVGPWDTESVDS